MKKMLSDVDKDGKERDWRGKKVLNRWLSESYERLGENKALRVMQCGSCLDFEVQKGANGEDVKRLVSAYFCHVPLCPMCAWRRSIKIFAQVSKVMNYVEPDDYRYVFLTLTVRNMPGMQAKAATDDILKAFSKLTRRKKFEVMSVGWFRCLEVTHNWNNNDYHPHLHVMIAVDKRYFTVYENYVKHAEWKDMWQSCLGVSYQPWVYVCTVNGKQHTQTAVQGTVNCGQAVAEIAKYAVKSADYLVMWQDRAAFRKKTGIKLKSIQHCKDLTDEVVGVLDSVLHRRRLVAFGGRLKQVHKQLNLDDPEGGDLVKTDEGNLNGELATILERYCWRVGVGNYELAKREQKCQ